VWSGEARSLLESEELRVDIPPLSGLAGWNLRLSFSRANRYLSRTEVGVHLLSNTGFI
jgi:hypothetical protein